MIIRKSGKCVVCKTACTESKEFPKTKSMFDMDDSRVTAEIKDDVEAWRNKDMFCDDHKRKRG